MAKKSGGKSGKAKSAKADEARTPFTIAGIEIPEILRERGVQVESLVKHPLVAGLAAMALESLAQQIRSKAAAATPAPAPAPAPAAAPVEPAEPAHKPARKPASKKAAPKKPAARTKPKAG